MTATFQGFPRLRKAVRIDGHRLRFYDAKLEDAGFIHGLRTNSDRAQFLSVVSKQLACQEDWLRRYAGDDTQAYFVVCDGATHERLGTVRLYGTNEKNAFTWGSWLLKVGLPAYCAIESALMVYHYGLSLGFNASYFEVHKDNVSVWRFHERFGAQRVGARGDQLLYDLSPEALQAALIKYRRYLPSGIQVHAM